MRARSNITFPHGHDTATMEPATIWPEKLVGGKHVRLLEKHLQKLHGEETHGNRRLFLDDVFVAYLLAFYNPGRASGTQVTTPVVTPRVPPCAKTNQ